MVRTAEALGNEIAALHSGWVPRRSPAGAGAAAPGPPKEDAFAPEPAPLEAWTDRGWAAIRRVVRHRTRRRIYLVATSRGAVETTEDHSIMVATDPRSVIRPREIRHDTEILHSLPAPAELAACFPLPAVLDPPPSPGATYTFGEPVAAQMRYLQLRAGGHTVQATGWQETQPGRVRCRIYELRVLDPSAAPSCRPQRVQAICEEGALGGYVYDLETATGTFQAGVGEIIVKNTDAAPWLAVPAGPWEPVCPDPQFPTCTLAAPHPCG